MNTKLIHGIFLKVLEYNQKKKPDHHLIDRSFRAFPFYVPFNWPLNLDFVLPGRRGFDLCDFWSILTSHTLKPFIDPDRTRIRVVENVFYLPGTTKRFSATPSRYRSGRNYFFKEAAKHRSLEIEHNGGLYIADRTICQYDFAEQFVLGMFSKVDELPDLFYEFYLGTRRRYLEEKELQELTADYLEYDQLGVIERGRQGDLRFELLRPMP